MSTHSIPDVTCHFSHPVDKKEVETYGASTSLPIRRNNAHREIKPVAYNLAKRWSEIVADGTSELFHGRENRISGNFDSLVIPEAYPDRLRHSIWFTEFFFLIDDKGESLKREDAHDGLHVQVANILRDARVHKPTSRLGQILVPAVRDLLECDYDRGIPLLEAYQEWLRTTDAQELSDINTFNECMDFQLINAGMLPYSRVVEYTMKLSITDAERESP